MTQIVDMLGDELSETEIVRRTAGCRVDDLPDDILSRFESYAIVGTMPDGSIYVPNNINGRNDIEQMEILLAKFIRAAHLITSALDDSYGEY